MSIPAIFLHGVLPYHRNAAIPNTPDWKSFDSSVESLIKSLNYEDYGCAKNTANDLASGRFGKGDTEELEDYLNGSEEVINNLHETTSGVRTLLDAQDVDTLSKEELLNLVENIRDLVEGSSPPCMTLGEMASNNWFFYDVRALLSKTPQLWSLNMFHNPSTDNYEGSFKNLIFESCGRGVIRLTLRGEEETLLFSSDGKIISKKGPSGGLLLGTGKFSRYFESCLQPSEEEIALFDVINPGMNWGVLRYLRDNLVDNIHSDG